jgi:ubiquinone/menaquinone biosynthesis C-methylase UbiE
MQVSKSCPTETLAQPSSRWEDSAITLHEESDDYFVYIVTYGRQSHRKHIVKVRFVPWATNKICVATNLTSRKPDWVQNLGENRKEKCILASKRVYGRIKNTSPSPGPLTNEDALIQTMASDLFKKKYKNWDSIFEGLDFVFIEYEDLPKNPGILNELEFDLQARRYTSTILENETSRWMREVTLGLLLKIYKPGQTLLEMGSGTGIETLELLKRGIKIVAIDVSKEMLSELQRRATQSRIENSIQLRHLSSSNVSDLIWDTAFPDGGFDGVFSTFGAINLEPDLCKLSKNIRRLVKKKALVTFAVWNRLALSDLLVETLQGDISLLRQRLSGRVRATSESNFSLDVLTYSPKRFASFFSQDFDAKVILGLPMIIPPYQYRKGAGLFVKFRKLDLAIGRLPIFRNLGENFVLTMTPK